MRRLSFAALILAAACSSGVDDACPGETVGSFLLEVSAQAGAEPSACAAEPPVADPPTLVVARFEARLTAEGSATGNASAALCPGGRAATYYGHRAEDGTYALEASSGMAVLDRCGPNCAVSVTERVIGAVTGEAATATFDGTLVESFEYLGGQCGDCALPCSATYALTTAVPAPATSP